MARFCIGAWSAHTIGNMKPNSAVPPGRAGARPERPVRLGVLILLALGAVPLAVSAVSGPCAGADFPARLWPAPPAEPADGCLVLQGEGRGAAGVLIDGRLAGTLRQGVLVVPVLEGNLVELDGRSSSLPLRVAVRVSAPLRLVPAGRKPLEPAGQLLLVGWIRGPAWP